MRKTLTPNKITDDVTEVPTKCVTLKRTVQVNAQVQYIDFEGRSDGESLLKILSQLRPRRLVVVRGNEESVQTVKSHCRDSVDANIYTPAKGETIDATSETHIYQVRITDALVSQLNFQKGKDAEVAWLDAQIVLKEDQSDAKPLSPDDEPMEGNHKSCNYFFLISYGSVNIMPS